MTLTAPAHRRIRPNVGARRFGYLIAIGLNAVFLYLVNVRPGWAALPFLTPGTEQVLGLFNFSVAASIVVNAAFIVYDAPWFKALGDLTTAAIGLLVLARIWQVFPFDFSGYDPGWLVLLTRTVLVVAIAGTVIAIAVNLIGLVRHTVSSEGEDR